jgi:cysteine desulfurase
MIPTKTERAYLDWNATAPLRPQARAAMVAALDAIGNPSSVHAEGREARGIVEAARESVALLVGAEPRHVVFTASGTEANVLALSPQTGGHWQRLLVSAIEHPSVRSGGRFPAVEAVAATASGLVDLADLKRRLAQGPASLVSLMLANNETGAVQPVAEAAALVHAAGGLLHVDAVQAAGRIVCDINVLGADLLTLSGLRSWREGSRCTGERRPGRPRPACHRGRAGARRARRDRERRVDCGIWCGRWRRRG